MIDLDVQDRQQLIALLQNIPQLATEQERRLLLEDVGLKKLLPRINLSGSSSTVSSQIVSYLSDYGRLSYDHEALGVFLNGIKDLKLVGEEQQAFLSKLLKKYGMMIPVAPPSDIDNWLGSETDEGLLEKIIGENTLRPIAFLTEGLKVAQPVAYVGVNTPTYASAGTGFLVAPDLLLTNNHVIPHINVLPFTIFQFNYEENFKGEAQPVSEYRAKMGGIFHSNEDKYMDYTIIQLEDEPGGKWGWLPLQIRTIKRDERVNIIQHAGGRPKQVSLQNNFVEYVGGNVIQYVTSTLPGSSGSPVFNDGWEVVALHHAGSKRLREPTTQRAYFRNEGILISKILPDLPTELRKKVSAAAANYNE